MEENNIIKKAIHEKKQDEKGIDLEDIKIKNDGNMKKTVYNQEDDFILDRFPANIEKAEVHAQAKQITKPIQQLQKRDNIESNPTICECCGYQITTENFSICVKYEDLSFLGPGVPLYFSFINWCSFLLLLGLIVFGIPNIYMNISGDDCENEFRKNECQKNNISVMSFANKKNDEDQRIVQSYINLATVFCLVIGLHIFRRKNRINEKLFDQLVISPSDYTAQLQDLPKNITKEKITEMLKIWWEETLQTKYVPEELQTTEEQFNETIKLQEYLKQEIEKISKKVEQQDPSIQPTSVAFVSFSSQQLLEIFLESQDYSWIQLQFKKLQQYCNKKTNNVLEVGGNIIKVDRAPEPSDVLAQFANTALLTLAANYFIDSKRIWSNDGLINDVFYIILTQAIVIPFNNYFSVFKLMRVYKRRQIRKSINQLKDICTITQGEANFWFEGNPLEMSNKYAHLIKIMWMTAFYAPLLPIIFVIGIFAMFLTYWVDKLLLLRRYTHPKIIGEDLNKAMIEKLEYFPLMMAIGNIFFQSQLSSEGNYKTSLPDIIAIIIGAVNFIIPSSLLNRFICPINWDKQDQLKEYVEDSKVEYDQAKKKFNLDYDRCNPITATKALMEWIKMIEEFGDENQKKQAKNINIQKLKGAAFARMIGQNDIAPPVNPMFQIQQHLGNQHMQSIFSPQQLENQYQIAPPNNPIYPQIQQHSLQPSYSIQQQQQQPQNSIYQENNQQIQQLQHPIQQQQQPLNPIFEHQQNNGQQEQPPINPLAQLPNQQVSYQQNPAQSFQNQQYPQYNQPSYNQQPYNQGNQGYPQFQQQNQQYNNYPQQQYPQYGYGQQNQYGQRQY